MEQFFCKLHEVLFCLAEICFALDIFLILFKFSVWMTFLDQMDSSESFLPCTALEKAADSTEEHQTKVLAALAQVPAKAFFKMT